MGFIISFNLSSGTGFFDTRRPFLMESCDYRSYTKELLIAPRWLIEYWIHKQMGNCSISISATLNIFFFWCISGTYSKELKILWVWLIINPFLEINLLSNLFPLTSIWATNRVSATMRSKETKSKPECKRGSWNSESE